MIKKYSGGAQTKEIAGVHDGLFPAMKNLSGERQNNVFALAALLYLGVHLVEPCQPAGTGT